MRVCLFRMNSSEPCLSLVDEVGRSLNMVGCFGETSVEAEEDFLLRVVHIQYGLMQYEPDLTQYD